MPLQLDTPVQYVKGVGPARAALLRREKIEVLEDLLKNRPVRYEDRTRFVQIRDLVAGEEAVVRAQVSLSGKYPTRRRRVSIFEMVVRDASGSVPVKFFNQPYLADVFKKGREIVLFGTPRRDSYSGSLTFQNPECEIVADEDESVHMGRIVPVYRKIGKLTGRMLRQIVFHALAALEPESVREPIPESSLRKLMLPGRCQAFRQLHFPVPPVRRDPKKFLSELQRFMTPAQQRFIFEEFFLFQLGLQAARARREALPRRRPLAVTPAVRSRLKEVLPFALTRAQKRVLKEIVEDLCSDRMMSRLLQGDVGSGKTIVALLAMLVAVENGFQASMMAPTELLAEQHFRSITRYLEGLPYQVGFLSSSVKGKKRKQIVKDSAEGTIDILVGTHALIEEQVEFRQLGLVIIDEQHRFGVLQRSRFMQKGDAVDTLVMTATPIPRSLALTVYGDLRVSILDELPPGRQPVRTVIKAEASRSEVYRVLRRELEKGNRVYIVYPLVEESDKLQLRAAVEMADHLRSETFPEYEVGLMHGRLKAEEKDGLMDRFRRGEVQVLVATTVIEVGIDVPEANVMVVEHADRFGLSQLHQLRGRIGRGRRPGLCILMVERVRSKTARDRLAIMRETSDGFRIAEKDLEIRGPGEFTGTRQSGLPQFLFGNIVRDRKLLELARLEAEKYLASLLEKWGTQQKLERLVEQWRKRFGLYEVG